MTKKTVGPDIGAAAAMPRGGRIGSADLCSCRFVGEKRQRRFFDEHGLDDGLSRPGRKIRPGDTLTKAGSSGKIGFFDEHGLDAGLARPGRKIRQGETLPKAGSSGKIGADLEKFWKN